MKKKTATPAAASFRVHVPTLLLVSALIFIMVAAAVTGCKKDNKIVLTAGFIFPDAINDGGWSQTHNDGRLELETLTGVETKYLEKISESVPAEAEQAIDTFAGLGCGFIVAASPLYYETVVRKAAEYPQIRFFVCTSLSRPEINNISTYYARIEEPFYLAGIAAGRKSVSGKIGYVASVPSADAIRTINSFTLGVRSVAGEAIVLVEWAGSKIDNIKIKAASESLLEKECDVIAQDNGSPVPMLAAAGKGASSIGYALRPEGDFPESHLASPVYNWGMYYRSIAESIMNGTWSAADYRGGMKEGFTELAWSPENNNEEAAVRINEILEGVRDGYFDIYSIFTGPVRNQDGRMVLKDGEVIKEAVLLGMNWFVEGVEGAIP
ncbi:MAG: BMP family ABC transporter substrate-binding protein [Eubacteriales bacterium]|nr:BMP family ABC transporter substrate-binding protein [Eubacteriales bacterium]